MQSEKLLRRTNLLYYIQEEKLFYNLVNNFLETLKLRILMI